MEFKDMSVEQLEARKAEIAVAVDAPEANLDELEAEARSIKDELETRKNIEAKKVEVRKMVNENAPVVRSFEEPVVEVRSYTASSPEYRTAWLKDIAVDERGKNLLGVMNAEERAAFTFITTNTAAVVPTEIANRIIELVKNESPILNDASMSFFSRGFAVPRHTAIVAGDAAVVAQGTANDDEQDTFELLTLSGVEIKKHIVMSKQMEIQSIDAFEDWLVGHLAARIRVAKEQRVLAQLDNATYGIAAANILTGTLSDAEIQKIFSQISSEGEIVVYANNKTIWTVIAALKDTEGNKLFVPSSMVDPLVAGRVYGAAIKRDANLADNVLYVGVPSRILCNDFDTLEIVPQIEPKTLNRIWTAYSLFDAGLEDPTAFVKYTHTPAGE